MSVSGIYRRISERVSGVLEWVGTLLLRTSRPRRSAVWQPVCHEAAVVMAALGVSWW